MRVVVIEDSRTQARQIAGVLTREGIEVTICADGEAGLASCLASPPDLVVSDIVMPGIDGFEVCRRLKAAEATQAVPVILLTSLADPTDVVRALSAGADNFLTKPYDSAQLIARVRRLVHLHSDDGAAPTVDVRGQTFEVRSKPARVLDVLVSSLEAVTARNAELEQSRATTEAALATAEQRAVQLRGLTEASLAINSAGSVEAALRVVAEQARRLLNAHYAETTLLASPGESDGAHTESRSEEYAGRHVDTDCPDEAGLRAPLIGRNGEALGSIHLCDRRAGEFSGSDEAVLAQLAQTASVAIANARLFEQTQRAVQARDEVVAVVSHDLRNPLNALIMAVGIAERRPDDAEAMLAKLAVIRRSAERMNRLIVDLLDVTRIDTGNLVLERERHAAGALIEEAVQVQRVLAESRGILLRAEVADGLPAIRADRGRLSQVFENLLGNALKFTPTGGAIVVRASVHGARVRFSVSDTGSGIPAEHLPHVFNRFWQERRTAGQGTGLGLSIVKGIVEAHGGEVTVESTEGRGSTFAFTLPAA